MDTENMAADEGQVLDYCKLAQAAYDAYDSHNGTCRYPLDKLLPALGLGGNGYVATSFIYATVSILAAGDGGSVNEENGCPHKQHWIGYVAVATDAERDRVGYRDIAVVWRGTSSPDEMLKDLQAVLVPIHGGHQVRPEVRVERGFESLYTSSCDACDIRTSARSQVLAELSRLVTYLRNRYPAGESIRVTATGHSLGGALALLTAWDAATPAPAAAAPALPGVVVRAVTFAAPRVGNQAFCDELVAGQRHVSVQRVIVDRDVVPTLPPTFFGYADAGSNVRLLNADHFPVPFLTLLVPWHFHSIKQYLRLLDPAPAPLLLPPAAALAPVPADHFLPVPEAELDNLMSRMIEFH